MKVMIDNLSKNRLVTLKPGRYWRVDAQDGASKPAGVDLKGPTNALLLEFQGAHHDRSECWHALVDGKVILVWESSFDEEIKI